MKKAIAIVTLLVVLAAGVFIGYRQIKPYSRPADASQDEGYNQILQDVEAMTVVPHTAGSPENEKVREYIVERAQSLGLEAEIQPFEMDMKAIIEEWEADYSEPSNEAFRNAVDAAVKDGGYSSMEEMLRKLRFNAGDADILYLNNILVKIEGQAEGGAVMFVSHYDSVVTAPGAADDGLAVACMMQLMEKLATGQPPRNDVYFLFTDGEENGLLGAAHFVRAFSQYASEIDVLFNFEARGNRGALLMFETSANNYELVRHYVQAVPQPVTFSLATAIYAQMPNGTDFTEFKDTGYYGLNFAMIEGDETYHQPTDNIENLNRDTAYQYYQTMMALGEYFAAANLDDIQHGQDAVFFPFPLIKVMVIPGWLARVLGFLPLLLAFVLIVLALRNKTYSAGRKVRRTIWLAIQGLLSAGITLFFLPAYYLVCIPLLLFLLADAVLNVPRTPKKVVPFLLVLAAVLVSCLLFVPIVSLVQIALKVWLVTIIFGALPLIPTLIYSVQALRRI